jgi:hypothetical protein
MVMIQHIEGDTCIATTTDDNTEIELDIPDCPFYPVNPCAVDDMTSLHYLHEVKRSTHRLPLISSFLLLGWNLKQFRREV